PPRPPYGAHSFGQHEPRDYVVQLWNRAETTHSVTIPKQYVIPVQFAWAASRLMRHGVEIQRLAANMKVNAEAYRVTKVEKLSEFQLHERLKIEAEMQPTEADLGAGCYVVDTDQPLGVLAAYLLEPMADDSLAAWNFLDPYVQEGGAYPILRVPAALPDGSLAPIKGIAREELITMESLMEPGKSVSYGGRTIRAPRWLKNSSEYVVTGGWGRTYAVDAETGSRRQLSELDSLRSKLGAMDAFTGDQARELATISAFTDDWEFATLSHDNDLYFFNAEQDAVRQLTHSKDEKEQLSDLSPTGEHVAFVRDNNLWVVNCESTESRQLTDNGSVELLNGILDWVYQEELYGRGNFKGFWWSPDGAKIAMLQLDQTPVPAYQVSDSTSFAQSLEATRYPKAGQPLPSANVFLVDVATGAKKQVDLSAWESNDRLIGRVSWSPTGELWLQVFNRVQNKMDLVRVDPETGASSVLFNESSPGWIEIRGVPEFLPEGDFLWLSDLPSGRTHLFQIDAETGQRTQLTSGEWEIDSLQRISSDFKTAFVTGNVSSPIEKQLLAVDLATGAVRQVTLAPGTHRTSVNATGEFFFDVFSSSDSQPFASLYRINGQLLRVESAPVSNRHQFLAIDPPRTFTIPARDGVELQAQLLLPPGFDVEKPPMKLPVLFYVYGGPQAPTVSNAWGGRNYWWHQMLAQQGFAVMLCDNRAARGRGVKDTWTIRGDMCSVELRDLEDAVQWVNSQPWADSERVGLWGWSYGGYFTSYALTHSNLFRCGIAGAPVTDWRNYDAIYTERYMDLPQDNPEGYDSSSVVKAAKNLSGELLIIHGERDDNVHMSNTLQLVNTLQQAGKQFELMIYPRNRHGITNPQQRYHLYQMMTRFLHRHLTPGAPAKPLPVPKVAQDNRP
ncbi:MAG: DPP IV N-terminal domain-containing protein, partial [Planctomycetota bacterium]